jgi:hypothetical protein
MDCLVAKAQSLTGPVQTFDQLADVIAAIRDIAKTANLTPARPFSDRNRDPRLIYVQANKNDVVHQLRPPRLRLGVGLSDAIPDWDMLWHGPPAACQSGQKV